MKRFGCFPIQGIRVPVLTVERYYQDFNDPTWSTFSLLTLGLEFENPGLDDEIVRWFRIWVCNSRVFLPGTIYVNPAGLVCSPRGDSRFIQEARQLQSEWFVQFNDVMASAGHVKRLMNQESPIVRQLAYTGVMFIDNRHVFPHQWPDRISVAHSPEPQQRVSLGERFGSLVVVETLTKGRLRCQCKCGNIVVKDRRHLVSGRTKSCGCLQAKRQEWLRNRRQDRGWKYTGDLRF